MYGFSKESWEEFSRLQQKLVGKVDDLGEMSVDAIPTTDIDNVVADKTPTGDTVLSLTGLSYFWAKIKNWASGVFRKSADKIQGADIADGAVTNAKIAGPIPVDKGGTGATTADKAWTNLGGGTVGKLNLGTSSTTFLRNDGNWSAPPNTDTNVSQSHSTGNAEYPVLLKNGTGTGNITSTSLFDGDVTVNPSTGTVTASTFKGALSGKATSAATADTATTAETCTGNAATATKATTADSATTAASCTGNAATATKLGTATKGSTTRPIYLSSGSPTECTPYPVGSEIRSTKSISPGTLYGGTWTLDSTYHDFRGVYIYRRTA